MAQNDTADETAAATATADETFEYPIRVEDAGPATKKVHVEIPRERITAKLEESFNELRQQAAHPRVPRRPRPKKLIEKRFSQDIKDQVRRQLISESYEQAVEKNNLQVIGEPVFDNPKRSSCPRASAAMSYSFESRSPARDQHPELKGIKIKRPKIEVTDENVQQAMKNLREQQGHARPRWKNRGVEDRRLPHRRRPREARRQRRRPPARRQVVSRPGRIAGIEVDDLDKQLEAKRPATRARSRRPRPEQPPNEALRGKEVEIEIALKDIKKLEPVEVNQDFLESLGFEKEIELLDALREQMVERIDYDVQQAMREQVNKHLLEQREDRACRPSCRRAGAAHRPAPRDGPHDARRPARADRRRTSSACKPARRTKPSRAQALLHPPEDRQRGDVDVEEAELNGRIACSPHSAASAPRSSSRRWPRTARWPTSTSSFASRRPSTRSRNRRGRGRRRRPRGEEERREEESESRRSPRIRKAQGEERRAEGTTSG
jgi:trigger factor